MQSEKAAWSMIQSFAPIACAMVLLGMIVVHKSSPYSSESIENYRASVKSAVSDIPYKVAGVWVGADVDVTPAAQQLLKPNVLFQRRYTSELTGHSIDLLLVHCGYIDDMGGHYPPICYPAHGWESTGSEHASIRVGPSQFPGRVYEFKRSAHGELSKIRITNFFIVPSRQKPILAERDELKDLADIRARSELGVAQVQIVSSADMPAEERTEAVAEFLKVLEPVIRVIGDGIQ